MLRAGERGLVTRGGDAPSLRDALRQWADEQVGAWADGQADERTEKLTDESYPDYEQGRFERERAAGREAMNMSGGENRGDRPS